MLLTEVVTTFPVESKGFDIRDYIDKLTPTKEKNKYICPVCDGNDFSINPSNGAYSCFHGCESRDIREALSRGEKCDRISSMTSRLTKRHHPPALMPQGVVTLLQFQQPVDDIPLPHAPSGAIPKRVRAQFISSGVNREELGQLTVTTYGYGEGRNVYRYECPCAESPKGRIKTFSQSHINEDGILKWTKGEENWRGYRLDEVIRLAQQCEDIPILLLQEGEGCVELAREIQLASWTLQGSSWSKDIKAELNRINTEIKSDKIICFLHDPDKAGLKKRDLVAEQCAMLGIPFIAISPHTLCSTIPEKGDIKEILQEMDVPDFIHSLEQEIQQAVNSKIEHQQHEDWGNLNNIPDSFQANHGFLEQGLHTLYGEERWICLDNRLYFYTGIYYKHSPDAVERRRITEFCRNYPVLKNDRLTFPYANPESVKKLLDWVKLSFEVDPSLENPSGVNCTNGILRMDFKRGVPVPVLVPHSPDEFYTYPPLVKYDPCADTTQADRLLECLEPAQQDVLMRVLGASLDLAEVRKRQGRGVKALLMCGEGSNGKDALRKVLSVIFGHRGMTSASLADFQSYDTGRKFPLACLRRSRVNWASENPQTLALDNLQSLKILVTGDSLHAEYKGVDLIEFIPECIALFNLNKTPALQGVGEAILSRIAALEFKKVFKNNPDPSNPNELQADPRFAYDPDFIREEVAPAFLNKMISGLQVLIEEGIDYSCTHAAFDSMKKENNHLLQWAEDCRIGYQSGTCMTATELWDLLKPWYVEQGTLSIDDNGKYHWADQARPSDKNVKAINQVIPRILKLFPRARRVTKYSTISKKNIPVIEGIGVIESIRPNDRCTAAPVDNSKSITVQEFRPSRPNFVGGEKNYKVIETLNPFIPAWNAAARADITDFGAGDAEPIEYKGFDPLDWGGDGAQIDTAPSENSSLIKMMLAVWGNLHQLGQLVLAASEEDLTEAIVQMTADEIAHIKQAANQAWHPGVNRDALYKGDRVEIFEVNQSRKVRIRFKGSTGNLIYVKRGDLQPYLGV